MTKTNVEKKNVKHAIIDKLVNEFRKTFNRHKRVKRSVAEYVDGIITGDDLLSYMVYEYGGGLFPISLISAISVVVFDMSFLFAAILAGFYIIYVVSVYIHAFFEYLMQ